MEDYNHYHHLRRENLKLWIMKQTVSIKLQDLCFRKYIVDPINLAYIKPLLEVLYDLSKHLTVLLLDQMEIFPLPYQRAVRIFIEIYSLVPEIKYDGRKEQCLPNSAFNLLKESIEKQHCVSHTFANSFPLFCDS